ncbi:MAG TPA: hypothetical protein VIK91_18275 [Nannocystis sp.]
MMLPVSLVIVIASPACDRETTPPEPRPGATYRTTRETPFYDSGCAQERLPDGKLRKNTTFILVGERDGCWNVKLSDEDEVYIRPTNVRAE